MILALQIGGGFIVIAALLQAGAGMITQFAGALRKRHMDQQRLAFFKKQTDILIKRAETDRQRNVLTWSGKRKFRVVRRQLENKLGDICSFYLEPHDGGSLPPFLPGQFLTFELNIPDQPRPVVRCYSLSGSPEDRDFYRISVRRLGPPPSAEPGVPPGLSSNFFHNNVKEGDVIDVMAPNGKFHLDVHSDRPVALIGGGVGLTPVLSMLKWLADTNSHREAWFFYAVRNGEDIACIDEIREIISNNSNFHLVVLYSDPADDDVAAKNCDCAGYLSIDVMKDYLKTSNFEFYICGPPPMMNAVTTSLKEWGVPEEDIRFEAFGPASVKKAAPAAAAESSASGGEAPTVSFARSNKSVPWSEAAETLLDLAEECGVQIASGCRAGNCGTCATAVKEGKVTYVTPPTSQPAKGTALVCIACPDGDIVLDA
ncbi:2Fe-2S iron-sulfur cluster-binding protein [Roseibium aggregatum]|uniref:2Fe-2S iron-sulfur cluster binding domain-containing protein n=1 Tax=Roseibium aggregatum TaxID=187304 RepID=A0A926P075_9HYPH|nr:2Fe-2S iron-sulfur cluster-binding protein [Roseibium aggregatum]MBD1547350.1 2Fe-2S iron-sulfur cluster binding domain-containing protein [Roseibium aggregatum]